jgi:steroid 5-alpha-reductase/3-oxo-5-alpha-steroid 4-dehydrogenase 1
MQGEHRAETVPLAFLGLWQIHYIHRVFIFPFRLRTEGKRIALLIGGLAIVFNTLNAYVVARWISHFGAYGNDWLLDPRFIAGVGVFMLGFGINLKADQILFNLRKPGDTGYRVPRGWLYEYVTCPNYLGEIIEWLGFALATWSLAGLAFALYTAANLGPRALANHRWYRERFPDYPERRKALVPFLF